MKALQLNCTAICETSWTKLVATRVTNYQRSFIPFAPGPRGPPIAVAAFTIRVGERHGVLIGRTAARRPRRHWQTVPHRLCFQLRRGGWSSSIDSTRPRPQQCMTGWGIETAQIADRFPEAAVSDTVQMRLSSAECACVHPCCDKFVVVFWRTMRWRSPASARSCIACHVPASAQHEHRRHTKKAAHIQRATEKLKRGIWNARRKL